MLVGDIYGGVDYSKVYILDIFCNILLDVQLIKVICAVMIYIRLMLFKVLSDQWTFLVTSNISWTV